MGQPRGAFSHRGRPMRSYRRSFVPPMGFQQQPGLSVKENITVKDLKEGKLNERVMKMVQYLSSSIPPETEDEIGDISIYISARFVPKEEKIEVEKNTEDPEVVLEGLQDALAKHLEKNRKLARELPEKIKKFRESQAKGEVKAKENAELKNEDGGVKQVNDEAEQKNAEDESNDLKSALEAHISKKKRLSEELLHEKNEENETPNKQAEGVTESVKKSKKKKRSKSRTLNCTNEEEGLEGAKKQKLHASVETPQAAVVSSPNKNAKRSKRNILSESEKLNTSQNSNVQTPMSNKKKNKNQNSCSESTPSNEKTPDTKNDAINSSLKSSKKKKRKSKQLQESEDYLPLSV